MDNFNLRIKNDLGKKEKTSKGNMAQRPRRRTAQRSLDTMLNLRAIERMTDGDGAWIGEDLDNIVDFVDLTQDQEPEAPAEPAEVPVQEAQPPVQPPVQPDSIPPENGNDGPAAADEEESTGGLLKEEEKEDK